ncbi:MAG: UDP-N-acetylmuramate--L-alanine ligase [Parcubacteria group bacterium]|jgi:UDP-N-acetylmuramate--alanine ligase|nr:UDP-N-acetylmuramate--L-alanine ligase [Parcubacteria group bacterium]|tara:strand:+ start:1428 stop:2717 length:1290 start_codon:yes stop_codon:yes gene_type:complete
MDLTKIKKAYLIGIKGTGMTALAQVLQSYSIEVLGSDTDEVFFTDQVLKRLKVKVIEGFNKKNVPADTDLVIASVAYLGQGVKNDEVEQAQKKKIPILTYAQVLGLLFKDKFGLAIAGTHGKSTTTAMLGLILEKAGLDPTVIVGTEVLAWQRNARIGQSQYLVAEADEYGNNFLNYWPQALILTNLEYDHPDFFKDFKAYQTAFKKLIKRIPAAGFIITNLQDKNIKQIIKQARCPVIDYSVQTGIKLSIPGQHNLLNGAAALKAACKLGIKQGLAKQSLAEFKGIKRRFEITGVKQGFVFVDDFAHHPTEVQVALKAARQTYPQKKIWAVFHPHTFTRTRVLLKDFGQSFKQADQIIILDIYGSAREKAGKIHARDLVREIEKHQPDKAKYIPNLKQTAQYLKKQVQSGELILTLGAGDAWKLFDFF